ncbi:SRPBCC family protein [Sphaerisporangium fuscum]|uniref:SRPBCC family protein n=1 Tax=Sphaerisporangium fuscum TaxID=2835868 RepID=UPI001BDD87A2|nr:SRPBCC family protein [Sphaerisporangium fuscum]
MEDYGVTGARVDLEATVDLPPERLWDLITSVPRLGEWSPECEYAAWLGAPALREGQRFEARNRRQDMVWSVTCVVTEAQRPSSFAWLVLDGRDDPDRPSSSWRYDLLPGASPEQTVVRHSFVHGPGGSGLRDMIENNPQIASFILEVRLEELRRHMYETLAAMTGTSPQITQPA